MKEINKRHVKRAIRDRDIHLYLPRRYYVSEYITVTVSVTDCSERDLLKRFDNTNIDWAIVQKQLLAWGELFCIGKKLD
jgi:hypothetical protein